MFMQLNGKLSNPLTDISAHSYHMSGWNCIDHDIVWGDSVEEYKW